MILRAENILGGCILTSRYAEDSNRSDGAVILTRDQINRMVDCLKAGVDYVIEDKLFVHWKQGPYITVLIQVSECTVPKNTIAGLIEYLDSRDAARYWQLQ